MNHVIFSGKFIIEAQYVCLTRIFERRRVPDNYKPISDTVKRERTVLKLYFRLEINGVRYLFDLLACRSP